VFGNRDEKQVEEKPLLLGRFLAGDEEKEKFGEAVMPHDLGGEVLAPDLDMLRVRRADARNRGAGLANQHDALLCRAARAKEGKARSEAAGFAAPDGDGVSFTFTGYFCRLIL
jgi:hypothetical protein